MSNTESDEIDNYRELYDDWLDYLFTGFNILIRGKGSKLSMVDEFSRDLPSQNTITIYGHNAGESIKSVIKAILEYIKSDIKIAKATLKETAKKIVEIVEECDEDYYLVIHNLDSTSFRDPLVLEVLDILLNGKKIHLIATLSNLLGDIYWNQDIKRNMRLVEYTINTDIVDQDEFDALNPKLANKHKRNPAENHSLESLDMVWTGLPENSHKIFLTMYQMAKNSENEEVQYHELLDELKKEMFTLNEQTLAQLMKEFLSHHVIKKTAEGTLSFTVEPVLLGKFVESKLVE